MQYRRFGKTELQMPVISCGGMRYQDSWKDVEEVSEESQRNVEACIRHALELGINHIETARGYGSSEYQLGKILPHIARDKIIVQTKVGPDEDVKAFEEAFERSMSLLKLDHVDLFSFHGINDQQSLEWTRRCYPSAERWKKEGRIRHIGFSTHGLTEDIQAAIRTDLFDYVNLHWYYIFQENWPAVEDAAARDMGVFIISPNDKGGMLYQPTEKLVELCKPLHPMVFNGLFCLRRPEVHTLSCGAARPEDFDIHMKTVEKLDQAGELVPPIVERLQEALEDELGEEWAKSWDQGLPQWHETPGNINLPIILRLRNLALAYGMVEYGKMRYNLLGNGGTWFPGQNAAELEKHDLTDALKTSPHAAEIPAALAQAHEMLQGEERKRLQED